MSGALSHSHTHGPKTYDRAFRFGIALNVAFVVTELVYGLQAHSLALVSDAGHNLSDVLGLVLAWGAARLATRRPTTRHTYGLRASSVLAALANAVLLLVAVGAIAWEAVRRLRESTPVAAGVIMAVASVGIVVNGVTALLFWSGRSKDLNIRGAFLHMAADAAVSAGVVVAGLLIMLTGRTWIDPVVSLGIVTVIAVGTWGLLRDSVNLALHAVPRDINLEAVVNFLRSLPGVTAVHDLHVWPMSTTEAALTVHVVRPVAGDDDAFLTNACNELHNRYGIEHATIQIERSADHFCKLEGRDTGV
jgi:cobalt-zinc-cadmium efflux system protein